MSETNPNRPRFRFSLLSLLSIVTLAAIYCTLMLHVPHLVVFAGVAALSGFLSLRVIRQKLLRKEIRWRLMAATLSAWCLMYVVSIGPAVISVRGYDDPKLQTVRTMYAPVIWLHNNTPMQGPLEFYVGMWGSWWMCGWIPIF